VACGTHFAFDPLAVKAKSQGCAGGMLLFLAVTFVSALLAHVLAVVLWRALPWTRARPLPDFILFPVPELLLAGLLVLPLAMASTTLLMSTGSVGSQVLGALAMALLLAYLALVAAVLLGVSARRELLGLRYVERPGSSSTAARSTAQQESPRKSGHGPGSHAGQDAAISSDEQPLTAHMPGSEDFRGQQVLLRVAPPHAVGHWERPDVLAQQELRRAYQGGLRTRIVTRCARQTCMVVLRCSACKCLQVGSAPRCAWSPASSASKQPARRCWSKANPPATCIWSTPLPTRKPPSPRQTRRSRCLCWRFRTASAASSWTTREVRSCALCSGLSSRRCGR
jgi:hypothetical protein